MCILGNHFLQATISQKSLSSSPFSRLSSLTRKKKKNVNIQKLSQVQQMRSLPKQKPVSFYFFPKGKLNFSSCNDEVHTYSHHREPKKIKFRRLNLPAVQKLDDLIIRACVPNQLAIVFLSPKTKASLLPYRWKQVVQVFSSRCRPLSSQAGPAQLIFNGT